MAPRLSPRPGRTARFYHKTGYTCSFPMSGHRTDTIIATTSTKEKEIPTILMSTLSIQIAAREADAKAKVAAAKKKAPKAKKETK